MLISITRFRRLPIKELGELDELGRGSAFDSTLRGRISTSWKISQSPRCAVKCPMRLLLSDICHSIADPKNESGKCGAHVEIARHP